MCVNAARAVYRTLDLQRTNVEGTSTLVIAGCQGVVLCGRLADPGDVGERGLSLVADFPFRDGGFRHPPKPSEDFGSPITVRTVLRSRLRPGPEKDHRSNLQAEGPGESIVEIVGTVRSDSEAASVVPREDELHFDCNSLGKAEDRLPHEVEEHALEEDEQLGLFSSPVGGSKSRVGVVEKPEEEIHVRRIRHWRGGPRNRPLGDRRRPNRMGSEVDDTHKRKRVERELRRVFTEDEEVEFECSRVNDVTLRFKKKRKGVEEESGSLDNRFGSGSSIRSEDLRVGTPSLQDVNPDPQTFVEVEGEIEDPCGERGGDPGGGPSFASSSLSWPPFDLRPHLSESDPGALSEEVIKLMKSGISKEVLKRKRKTWSALVQYLNSESLPLSPQSVCSFLSLSFYEKGWSGASLNTAKSDIVTTVRVLYQKDWSADGLVKALLKSVKKLSRPRAKYSSMWDIAKIYNYFRSCGEPTKVVDKRAKAIVLIRASLAGRAKDVHRIARSSVRFSAARVRFRFFAWKQQKENDEQLSSEFFVDRLGDDDRLICAFSALREYMTANKTNYESELGVKHDLVWTKYNSGACIVANTVSSDSRKVMALAGVDVKSYGPATIRHAAISKWRTMGVSRERVAERTFHRSLNIISFYYDKSVVVDLNASMVAERGSDSVFFDEVEESEEEFW